jgi:putative transposase
MNEALCELAEEVGMEAAANALGVPRSTAYRWQQPKMFGPRKPRPRPAHALSEPEQARVLEVLHDDRFVDKAPATVYATLLDQGEHLCSVRTMYRVLASQGEVRERRAQCTHPTYARPELLANGPNEVWTWDVTWLRGPDKYLYYRLFVLLDLFSRFVTGWMLAHEENGELAAKLIRETYKRHNIQPGQLVTHADRGSAQKGKTVKQLLADLEVTPSFSRPRVSNDNPFSESQFRTLKYAPDFPGRFPSFDKALEHCRRFFNWYNNEHKHSGIALMTPADVFYGHADDVVARRQAALDAAYAQHPERFRSGPPKAAIPPATVYLNPPEDRSRSELVVP